MAKDKKPHLTKEILFFVGIFYFLLIHTGVLGMMQYESSKRVLNAVYIV